MSGSPAPENVDLFALAVTLGRIEEKVSGIVGLDERVRKLEQTVERIEAKQSPKVPWWQVVSGIAGIGAIVLAAIALLNVISPA